MNSRVVLAQVFDDRSPTLVVSSLYVLVSYVISLEKPCTHHSCPYSRTVSKLSTKLGGLNGKVVSITRGLSLLSELNQGAETDP